MPIFYKCPGIYMLFYDGEPWITTHDKVTDYDDLVIVIFHFLVLLLNLEVSGSANISCWKLSLSRHKDESL